MAGPDRPAAGNGRRRLTMNGDVLAALVRVSVVIGDEAGEGAAVLFPRVRHVQSADEDVPVLSGRLRWRHCDAARLTAEKVGKMEEKWSKWGKARFRVDRYVVYII